MRTYINTESQGSWAQDPNFKSSDFCYGAKTTTSLPPTTNPNTATFDLPDWMETTDFLGVDANSDMWNNMFVPTSGINPIVNQQWETQAPIDAIVDLDNKYILNIQPEDMLVPLTKFQPKTTNITTDMQAIQQPPLANRTTPIENQKIVICVRKVSVPNNKERSPAPYIVVSPPKQNVVSQQVVPQYNSEISIIPQKASVDMNQVGSSQSDQLFYELMQMIGSDVKPEDLRLEDLTETLEAFDNDAFVDGQYSEIQSNSNGSELNYCHALPSPVPSTGSLSPCHSERGFLSPPQTVAFVDMSLSPRPCSTVDTIDILSPPASVHSELNVMSPAPSVSESNIGSPAVSSVHSDSFEDADSQDSSFNVSQDELHSYSRSTNKSKSSRRSYGSRATPYSESRKERKKEQNKQAALRYRQKKKQEEEDAHNMLKREEERQKELKEKYSNIKQEMTYLKKIMREVFIAKGVLSADSFKNSN